MRSKKARESGLELLRIIAMFMIVASHLSQNGNWAWLNTSSDLTLNQFLMNVVICFGQVGVAIFFSITGYYLYNSKTHNLKRIFKILRPTWFYSLSFLILAFLTHSPSATLSWPLNSLIAHSIFPIATNAYWFVSTYIALYLLLPYIKIWLDNLNDKKLFSLLFLFAGLYIIPNLISYIFADVASHIFVIPAALFYTITGYTICRCKNKISRLSNLHLILICLSGIIIYILSSMAINFANTHLNYININNYILIDTMSLPCIITSIPLVVLFSRLKFINRFINYLASLVFGVYLIHSNGFFIEFVWQKQDLLHTTVASNYNFLHFTVYFIITVLLIFCSCVIIEALRKLLIQLFLKFKKLMIVKNLPGNNEYV